MAIVVETGAGIPGAESFVSVDYADAYCSLRHESWAKLAPAKKEAALLQASTYIGARWGDHVVGQQLNPTQGLAWPIKAGVLRSGSYPQQLLMACVEYAVIAARGGLTIAGQQSGNSQTDAQTGITTVVKKRKVGPIEVEFETLGGKAAAAAAAASANSQANGWMIHAVPDGLMRAVVWTQEQQQVAGQKPFPKTHRRTYR